MLLASNASAIDAPVFSSQFTLWWDPALNPSDLDEPVVYEPRFAARELSTLSFTGEEAGGVYSIGSAVLEVSALLESNPAFAAYPTEIVVSAAFENVALRVGEASEPIELVQRALFNQQTFGLVMPRPGGGEVRLRWDATEGVLIELVGMLDWVVSYGGTTAPTEAMYSLSQPGGFVLDSSPIPEPSTALLMGLGLIGLAARRRREITGQQ